MRAFLNNNLVTGFRNMMHCLKWGKMTNSDLYFQKAVLYLDYIKSIEVTFIRCYPILKINAFNLNFA